MKFVKENEEKRRDYIFKKDKKTVFGARFIIAILILLVIAVAITYSSLA